MGPRWGDESGVAQTECVCPRPCCVPKSGVIVGAADTAQELPAVARIDPCVWRTDEDHRAVTVVQDTPGD